MTVHATPDVEEQAAQVFARRRLGKWSAADESELKIRLGRDCAYADAYRRVEQSWAGVGKHATSAELMMLREQAISRARRANARRWLATDTKQRSLWRAIAASGVIAAVLGAYQFAPFGWKPGEYRTRVGEQRAIELDDHSRVALDATTELKVHFSSDARVVQLIQGQAQFSVAQDPARPFKVQAGSHTVVALGTVFTVEYIDRKIHVAMLEGKVAVLPSGKSGAADEARAAPISLSAGEELSVTPSGKPELNRKADLDAATAWRSGKVIFHAESLGDAVRRLNRYSRLRIEIADPALASMRVSGVFEAGDAQAFTEAVQAYLPVTVDRSEPNAVWLRAR